MKRNSVIPAVFIIVQRSEKILLLERMNTGWNDGMFTLPSGHIEKNEAPQDAIIREVNEEVGIKLEKKDLIIKTVLYRKSDKDEERVDFIFECNKWKCEPINNEPHKARGVIWADRKNLPENTIGFIKEVINSKKEYLEIGY
jgi:8-oxo-dGTP pyrophosphatase MutT (NUDIX family)